MGFWLGVCIVSGVRTAAASPHTVQSITAEADRVVISLSETTSFTQAALPGDARRNLKDRCYVDVKPAVLDLIAQRYIVVDSALIHQVRTAQFQADTVRVVLDLVAKRACQVTVLTDPPRLQIEIPPDAGSTPDTTAMTPTKEAAMEEKEARLTPPAALPDSSVEAMTEDVVRLANAAPSATVATEPATTPTRVSATIYPAPTDSAPTDSAPAEPEREDPTSSLAGQAEEMNNEQPSRVLSLEESYQLAVVNEEQVAIAARELAKAELLPWRAIALMTPRGEIGGSYTRNKDAIAFNAPPEAQSLFGGSSVIRPRDNWLATFEVTQPLIEPSFFPSWRLGKEAVREGEERYEFTVRGVLFGVAQAYYEVLRFEAQVKVAQDTLSLSQEELKRAQARFRVGEVTKTDVLRAEVAVERAERALVVDQNRLKLSRTVLARTVGLSEIVGVMEPSPSQSAGSDFAQLLDQAYAQRQDLRAQNLAVQVAQERKNLVLTRYLPQVNAQFSYPRLDPETFANRDEFWTLFVNLRWSIFDGGNREIDLLEANENLSQAELRVSELEKKIRVEVREALLTVETLYTTLQTLRKEVALARENYDITSKQYRVGLSTSLDINTSLNALNQVRTQLADQSYAYQVALLNLDNAIGVFAEDYLPQR